MQKRIRIPFKNAAAMLWGYARTRIVEQIKLVAFIIIYLVAFQTLVLGVPLSNALSIAGGIAMVVFGLAFFLEGLILALMPVGEQVGVKLPVRTTIVVISLFGFLLGFGSTLAEPAISALRAAGSTVTAWDAPLLYMLLEHFTEGLVLSVGVGVGIAVVFGMIRFYYGLSIKPFIYVIIPLLLVMSVIMSFNPNLSTVIGLAWDSGAVTTGAVTVPLVLALGIGVSRASERNKGSSGGFGIILLASAFPIISVLLFSLSINTKAPQPTTESEFFSPERRELSLQLFENEQGLLNHAYTRASDVGRRAFYQSEEAYHNALINYIENPHEFQVVLGSIPIATWISSIASDSERKVLASARRSEESTEVKEPIGGILKEEGAIALRAVLPLTALLLLALTLFLRDKPRYKDEVALGVVFAVIGMTLLTSGIRLGLAPLGSEVGSQLPIAFKTDDQFVDYIIIDDFDSSVVVEAISPEGRKQSFFYLQEGGGYIPIEYKPDRHDPNMGTYQHFITRPPMFGPNLSILGIALVFLFAFGMGFGSTLAEPALNALGITVEEITVGTVKRHDILKVVSVGVGLGLLAGVARILYDIPLVWLLVPPYLLLIVLTYLSDEEFASIAWDCGGVTTGPVTVPLVLAMGLSIGSEMNVSDGFGILAMASAFPILTVLLFGLYRQSVQRKSIQKNLEENDNE